MTENERAFSLLGSLAGALFEALDREQKQIALKRLRASGRQVTKEDKLLSKQILALADMMEGGQLP